MNDRVMQFRVGVMVLATAIIAGILIVLFGDLPSLVQRTYPLRMNFSDARGVTPGTPVRKNGILVGRVATVALDAKGGVNVVAEIDSTVPIYKDEEARISGSLLGDAEISLVPGIIQPQREKIAESDVLRGAAARNPFDVFASLEPKLGLALDSLVQASESVNRLSATLDHTLLNPENGERFQALVKKTEKTLDDFSLAMTNINAVVGNAAAREEILDTIGALPEVIADLRGTVKGIGTTVEAADRNLRNLEGLTKPLGERGGEMVAQIDKTIGRLDAVLQEIASFAKALGDSQGTLGKLVNDPKVYDELALAVSNVNHLTLELRPIVDDVRVFTDKIARHPEQLGVRGALDRRPAGIK
jgi:phospholipid/cholesterol/gamma-HCH transport system substrate-binding protein